VHPGFLCGLVDCMDQVLIVWLGSCCSLLYE
jgi:hypothetical protein